MRPAEVPEMIAWEEPWRDQTPLRVPLRSWLAAWKMVWAELGHPFLLALPPCAIIVWFVRDDLTATQVRQLVWMVPKLVVLLLVLPAYAYYATALLLRCWYAFSPPFAQVTRAGVRLPLRFIPFSKIEQTDVLEAGGRAWLTLASGRLRLKSEIPSSVDRQALQALLAARDVDATKPIGIKTNYDSLGRLLLAQLACWTGFLVVATVMARLMTLLFSWP